MKQIQIQRGVDRWPGGPGALLLAGPEPEKAAMTVLCIHGRGAPAQSILSLFGELGFENLAAIAPEAAGRSWYPHSFLSPLEANQPHLDAALARMEWHIAELDARGIPAERVAFLGFSQGACLATEFVARHPRRYAAVLGLSGGLIGPPGTPRNYRGSLAGTPVFLGSGDPDPHVPFGRVEETRAVLARMGAGVELRRYPGLGHSINDDEIDACRDLLRSAIAPAG
jgi:predicted esterase